MARKPACVNHGVSVDVVCYALRATSEDVTFTISVAMHLHPTDHRWQLPPDQHLVWKPPGATSHRMPAARRRSLHEYRR